MTASAICSVDGMRSYKYWPSMTEAALSSVMSPHITQMPNSRKAPASSLNSKRPMAQIMSKIIPFCNHELFLKNRKGIA